MHTIWKFEIEVIDAQIIEMPQGAIILCVQTQEGRPVLWARVNPDNPKVGRKIITHGTGHLVQETTGDHIGTYQLHDGALVFHVFEAA